MPDIVPNLLHLSSEVKKVAELLEATLELVLLATDADAAAYARATLPHWSVDALRGVTRSAVPIELAAESLEQGHTIASEGWLATPLGRAFREAATQGEPEYVLLLRSKCPESRLATIVTPLSEAMAIVDQKVRTTARVERLQTILEITNQWHQTNDMQTLLVRMAEAATRLFNADRSSIFLWDKPNRVVVGRPALGVEKGELRLPDDTGIVGQVIQTGEPHRVNSKIDEQEIDRAVDKQTGYCTKTILCVPINTPDGNRIGAFELLNKQSGIFSNEDQCGLIELASYAAIALANTQQFAELVARQEKMVAQAAEDVMLIGESAPIQAVRATARRVADTDLTVLLLGENGTGKEVVSRSIHFGSKRRKHPFIAVNCAAITETLLESELFGHEKGAFTDAHETRFGKFELASGGTLLLDEIGDMSLAGQSKLLRVLEEKTIIRVGGSKPIHTDVRLLAATNQKLVDLVCAKRFREDLYFRLNVVTLELPPLRTRGDDAILLAEHFLRDFSKRAGRRPPKFSAAARQRLESHNWPGNVRELRNLMERLAFLFSGDRIEAEDLALNLSPPTGSNATTGTILNLNDATHEYQRKHIQEVIDATRGNVSQAAKNLGVHRSNLYRKMRLLGMKTIDEDS